MKAGIVEGANNFILKHTDQPTVSSNGVLVKVAMMGVNYADTLHITGISHLKPPQGTVGTEYSGEVVQVGKDVTEYIVGDRVVSLTGNALAEYATFEAEDKRVAKIPGGLSYEVATTIAVQGLTALTLIQRGYEVKKGDYVLVHAAAGGVGSHLIKAIRHQGGIVIASTSSDEKVKYCNNLGADYVINYKKENTLDRILKITKGKGVHLVLDSVGRTTFETSLKSLRSFGVVIVYGMASGPIESFNPIILMGKNTRVQGSSLFTNMPTKQDAAYYFKQLFDLYEANVIEANIYKTYDFDNAAEAFRDIQSGNTFGKLLIKIN